MDKERLKKKFREGNRKAFRMVYDDYADAMYAICLRYTKNTDEAADILQNSFIKIHEKCGSFNPEYELGGWIKRIVINTAINHFRQNKKIELTDNFEGEFDTEDNAEIEYYETKNLHEQLLEILKEIPEGYQTVFNLFVFENLSHKEIADYLSISESTSKTQLFKARKAISKKLIERKIIKP